MYHGKKWRMPQFSFPPMCPDATRSPLRSTLKETILSRILLRHCAHDPGLLTTRAFRHAYRVAVSVNNVALAPRGIRQRATTQLL
jgi:hypothetical protein